MKNKIAVLASVVAVICIASTFPFNPQVAKAYHTDGELEFFKNHKMMTPIASGEFFLVPTECQGCHGYDTLGLANVDANGHDVNLFDDWETSMMGLSARDPLWRAKLSHEILNNPSHSIETQNLCITCHAPAGHYTAMFHGQQHYTLADLVNDSLGLSGVSCTACHAIGDSSTLGSLFTGNIPYDTNKVMFGPFEFPVAGPMQLYVGYTPTFSTHVSEGRFCSPCHTLISSSFDLNNVPTGTTFIEQATYHEWLNSAYPSQDTKCQTCHMPQIEDPVVLANGNIGLPGRTPFNLHQFAGANSFMVKLIKQNKTALGVNAPDYNFDSTLVAIDHMLTTQALDATASLNTITNDTAYVDVVLKNKAGHKFPSGYPSRRAVVQMIVTKANGDTLFASGLFDSNYEVVNPVTPFEPHHDIITSPNQKQIYEMVMGNVIGNPTTILEQAYAPLKDNRIPPLGFTTQHNAYDTCKIIGSASSDLDFNFNGSIEGTGKDVVHYHISLGGYSGTINVYTAVYYQTLPPAFLSDMSTFSSPEINAFMAMYANADKSPVKVTADSLLNIQTGITSPVSQNINVIPNPTSDGRVVITNLKSQLVTIELWDQRGKQIQHFSNKTIDRNTVEVQLPQVKGIYYMRITINGQSQTKKILYI
ncbi:MAG: T9SS type A sorting domain-containing protein [Bacteroidetes bacterium]|nr:T9SS type A sorting domain-containing protein [Bacteroidota bacterium]